jgi:hypothetical protein
VGFGFSLGGVIRVSTSGVGIGPRAARVRVGRGGVGVSAGPRATRVHVGTRGVGVSSGVGPVSVSSWGARVGVGVGPGYLGVGTGGARTLVGAGPVWFSGGGRRHRTGGRGVQTGPSLVAPPDSRQRHVVAGQHISAAGKAEYDDYMSAMRSAGVQRRNQQEIWTAALTAYLNEMATLVAWASPFEAASRPEVPLIPPRDIQREVTKQRLREDGLYRWYRSGSATLLTERTEADLVELSASRTRVENQLDEAYALFEAVDPYMNLLVIQAAYLDNLLPAAPVDIDGTDLLVFMTFCDADRIIWPEKFRLLDSGLPGVSKLSDSEKNARHFRVLKRCMAATAKEALATQPVLSSVRVVALDEHGDKPLHERPVYGDAIFTRDNLKFLSPPSGWEDAWNDLVNTWRLTDGAYVELLEEQFMTFFNRCNDDLLEAEEVLQSEVLEQMVFRQEGRKGELRTVCNLGDLFSVDVLETLDVSEMAEDGSYFEPQSPADVSDYEFWLEALELRKVWRTATVAPSKSSDEVPEASGVKEPLNLLPGQRENADGATNTASTALYPTVLSDRLDVIEELADLVDLGVMTPEEFQNKKQQLFDGATDGRTSRRSQIKRTHQRYAQSVEPLEEAVPPPVEDQNPLAWWRTRLFLAVNSLPDDSRHDEGSNFVEDQHSDFDEDFEDFDF